MMGELTVAEQAGKQRQGVLGEDAIHKTVLSFEAFN
jgi:hypothetical protein